MSRHFGLKRWHWAVVVLLSLNAVVNPSSEISIGYLIGYCGASYLFVLTASFLAQKIHQFGRYGVDHIQGES